MISVQLYYSSRQQAVLYTYTHTHGERAEIQYCKAERSQAWRNAWYDYEIA